MKNYICPVCENNKIQPLVQQDRYDWQECADCGFAFISDFEKEPALDYGSEERGDAYIDFYGDKYKSKLRRSYKRARYIKKRMNGPRILDVGCNLGYFVESCRLLGLDSVGIDVNTGVIDQASAMFPKSRFVYGRIDGIVKREGQFDAVYTSEVIEHVDDVNSFISNISSILKPGGLLYLTTPELKKYRPGFKGDEWKDLNAPNHKQYFSKTNIRYFLDKHKYESIEFIRNWNFKTGIKLIARKR